MRTHRLLLIALITAVDSGCSLELCLDAPASSESEGSTSQPIVGGQVDTTNRSVVALTLTLPDGRNGVCSGTVIAKHDGFGYVLTAAHCVQGTVDHVYEATDWRDCSPAGDPAKCGARYQPIAWEAHPDFDVADGYRNDFAIVTVSGATEETQVTPVATDEPSLENGDHVVLAGFGRTQAGPATPEDFPAVRHQVEVPIDESTEMFLRFDATGGKTACFGDSGGPALATIDGELRVVAVASTADEYCEHVATYGRTSQVYSGFIAPIISSETGGAGGAGGAGGGPGGAGGASSTGSAGSPPIGAGGQEPGDDTQSDESASSDCVPAHLSCATSPTGGVGSGQAPWLVLAAIVAVAMRRRASKR